MPSATDPFHMHVDHLPGVWSPVQWELNPDERVAEVEDQARASLLWNVDAPESILRLLLNETDIERIIEPPKGYDHENQGEWDDEMVTFAFKRFIKLVDVERRANFLSAEYDFLELGKWVIEIEPEKITIEKI
ncbi:MAG: hypothetical protein N2C13_02885 [Chloroflexota bacterium]